MVCSVCKRITYSCVSKIFILLLGVITCNKFVIKFKNNFYMEYLMKFVNSIPPCGMTNLVVNGYVFKWDECGWRFVEMVAVDYMVDDSAFF